MQMTSTGFDKSNTMPTVTATSTNPSGDKSTTGSGSGSLVNGEDYQNNKVTINNNYNSNLIAIIANEGQ